MARGDNTPENCVRVKNPALTAGTILYGIQARNRGTVIELLDDQQRSDGRLTEASITGEVIIHKLGAAARLYSSLKPSVDSGEAIYVEDCTVDILNQDERRSRGEKDHHLFRFNGYAVKRDLTENERASYQAEILSAERKGRVEAELDQISADNIRHPDTEGSHPDLATPIASPLPLSFEAVQAHVLAEEGRRVLEIHYRRERDPRLVAEAKANYKLRNPLLTCQACPTSMITDYGIEYIEAHHRDPIGKRPKGAITSSDDFDMLCPNCHRAIHRMGEGAVLADLIGLIDSKKKETG